MSEIDLDYFEGTWRVERTIEDAMSDETGAFDGTATFRPDEENLLFEEVGTVRFASYRGAARRRLFYSRLADGSLEVTFADGHHFIALTFVHECARDEHHCGHDLYEITTVVRSPDCFEEVWRVRGPAKDYRAATVYSRLAD